MDDHPIHDRERPPSLRAVLDAGCELTATGVSLRSLGEKLYNQLPRYPPKERARRAAEHRAMGEDILLHGNRSRYLPAWSDWSRGMRPPVRQIVTELLWMAEAYEDERLADRLRAALPRDVAAKCKAEADIWRRPHPLEVKVPERWWMCQNCGQAFDQGEQEALVVTEREGHSRLDYEIPYCLRCIRMLGEATREVTGPSDS